MTRRRLVGGPNWSTTDRTPAPGSRPGSRLELPWSSGGASSRRVRRRRSVTRDIVPTPPNCQHRPTQKFQEKEFALSNSRLRGEIESLEAVRRPGRRCFSASCRRLASGSACGTSTAAPRYEETGLAGRSRIEAEARSGPRQGRRGRRSCGFHQEAACPLSSGSAPACADLPAPHRYSSPACR